VTSYLASFSSYCAALWTMRSTNLLTYLQVSCSKSLCRLSCAVCRWRLFSLLIIVSLCTSLPLETLQFVNNCISVHRCNAVTAAPVKRAGKADQTASKPTSQSSVFVFKGSQAAPAANSQTASARPAGMSIVGTYGWSYS